MRKIKRYLLTAIAKNLELLIEAEDQDVFCGIYLGYHSGVADRAAALREQHQA